MQCNIDARGKATRLILGACALAAGVVLLVLRSRGVVDGDIPLVAGIALVAFGAFGMFEGWAGWCAVRAMGWRTPL